MLHNPREKMWLSVYQMFLSYLYRLRKHVHTYQFLLPFCFKHVNHLYLDSIYGFASIILTTYSYKYIYIFIVTFDVLSTAGKTQQ